MGGWVGRVNVFVFSFLFLVGKGVEGFGWVDGVEYRLGCVVVFIGGRFSWSWGRRGS